MTEKLRAEQLSARHADDSASSRPRIQPAQAWDTRPVSISARLGRLQFHDSGKFRVLVFADVQDGPNLNTDTTRLMEASLDAARPDVVIFTGNQIAGYDEAYADTFRKRTWTSQGWAVSPAALRKRADDHDKLRDKVRGFIAQLVAPLVRRGIPWAVTYGNHDFQCGLSCAEQDAIYREFPGCLNPEPDTSGLHGTGLGAGLSSVNAKQAASVDEADAVTVVNCENQDRNNRTQAAVEASGDSNGRASYNPAAEAYAFGHPRRQPGSGLPDQLIYPCEPGTFALPVSDVTHSSTVLGLVVLNSGDYGKLGGYAAPSPRSMDFLRVVPKAFGVESMVFQHIPLPQYYDLLKEVPANAAHAVEGYRTYAGRTFVIDEAKTDPGSFLGEGVSCPDMDMGEFSILTGAHAYFAVLAGHDHRNRFVGRSGGLTMMATPTCGFGSYGPAPTQRASRLLEFDIRHPYEPRTQLFEFGEFVGKPKAHGAYTFDLNGARDVAREGTDLLRKPSFIAQVLRKFHLKK